MEALLVALIPALVEALLALATIVPVFVVSTVVFVLEVLFLLCELVFFLFFGKRLPERKKLSSKTEERRPGLTKARRISRYFWYPLLGLSLVSLLFILSANYLFFDSATRWIFARIENKTGIAITAQEIEGSLFDGTLSLEDITLVRSGSDKSNFSLTAKGLFVDVALASMLSGPKKVETFKLVNFRGDFERLEKKEKKKKKKLRYQIDSLILETLHVRVADHTPKQGRVDWDLLIETLNASDVSSFSLMFDILFHSNAKISIDGEPIILRNERGSPKNSSHWTAKNLPVYKVKQYFGGPMMLLSEGRLDFDVLIEWSSKSTDENMKMKWDMVLRDFRAEVPAWFTLKLKTLSFPVVKYLNTNSERLPLSFTLNISKNGVDFTYSHFLDGLAKAVHDALIDLRAKASGLPKEQLIEKGKEQIEHFKKKFPKIRLKKNPERSSELK